MSYKNPEITTSQVIPTIETEIFDVAPESRFAVGMIAEGNEVNQGLDSISLGYYRLRARVYADQNNFIPKESVTDMGTEHDDDDRRSVHFAIIENLGREARVVAAMRLIVKSHETDSPLPIEEFFPEAFKVSPAPSMSTEVSRYICRHEDKMIQNKLKWPLYSAALSHSAENELGPTFAIIEEPLERGLIRTGIPIKRITEQKFVPEYNSDNFGISIDTIHLTAAMNASDPTNADDMKNLLRGFVYSGRLPALSQSSHEVA